MNRSGFVLILLLAILVIGVFLLSRMKGPQEMLWYPRYEYQNGKMPYDIDVLVDLLKQDVGKENVITLNQSFHLEKNLKNSGIYLSIVDGFYPDSLNSSAILKYVEKGNVAFIAAENFDQEFMNKLFESTDGNACGDNESVNAKNVIISDSTFVYLTDSTASLKLKIPRVTLNWRPFKTFGYSCLPNHAKIRGTAENGGVNLIELKYGRGKVLLHSMPVVCTNYVLTDPSAFNYLRNVFKPVHFKTVYIDDLSFKRQRIESESSEKSPEELGESAFKHIFANKSLRLAFVLLLLGSIIFILAASRRKSPVINVIQSPINSSISFSKSIAQLYWLNPNHKKMAEKRMRYFLTEIRNRYHIETNELDEAFIQTLTHKTGVEKRHIAKLFERYQITLKQQKTHADQLTQISDAIGFIRNHWK